MLPLRNGILRLLMLILAGYVVLSLFETKDMVIKTSVMKYEAKTGENSAIIAARRKNFSCCKFDVQYLALIPAYHECRLGNRVFRAASLYGIARKLGRVALFRNTDQDFDGKMLSLLFDFDSFAAGSEHENQMVVFSSAKYTKVSACCAKYYENKTAMYSQWLIDQLNSSDLSASMGNLLQSYRYFSGYEQELHRFFTFRNDVQSAVRNYLQVVRNTVLFHQPGLHTEVVYVGVHIRRGDYVELQRKGYRVANMAYIYNALSFMFKRLVKDNNARLAFIVCSEDPEWFHYQFSINALWLRLQQVAPSNSFVGNLKGIVSFHYPFRIEQSKLRENWPRQLTSADRDFAILSHCNHSVMTAGTFGYWSSFLAGGLVTYYDSPIEWGSERTRWFGNTIADHYMPQWVALPGHFHTSII